MLVSLITPCYNSAEYIHRLLDSVLSQTYSQIEMYVIDDGSTDNSRDIIMSYVDRYAMKGYTLNYIYQENSGQSVAIQKGLLLIKGKYLAWPDSDDYYCSDNAIEMMVNTLENASSEFAIVRTMQRLISEDTMQEIEIIGVDSQYEEPHTLFEDCIWGRFYYAPGSYLVRVDALRETTNLEIYTAKEAGQNWQIYLPLLYSYRCLTIKEPLYCVLARSSSHSRSNHNNYEKRVAKLMAYENTLVETIKRIKKMPEQDKGNFIKRINYNYLRKRFLTAFEFQIYKDCICFYTLIKEKYRDNITTFDKILYFSIITRTDKFVGLCLHIYVKFINKFKNDC